MNNTDLNILDEINKKIDRLLYLVENNKKEARKKLVKIEEAVIITGYKKKYIYLLTHQNKIPYLKVGNSLRFDPEELEKWMKAGRPSIINEVIGKLK